MEERRGGQRANQWPRPDGIDQDGAVQNGNAVLVQGDDAGALASRMRRLVPWIRRRSVQICLKSKLAPEHDRLPARDAPVQSSGPESQPGPRPIGGAAP